jgi:hypothetical protein
MTLLQIAEIAYKVEHKSRAQRGLDPGTEWGDLPELSQRSISIWVTKRQRELLSQGPIPDFDSTRLIDALIPLVPVIKVTR